jgi:peptide/nickel transport system permease protein
MASTLEARAVTTPEASTRRARNWPLWLGATIVALVVFVAVAGPWLAPRDPMARVAAIDAGERWIGPPYPIFTPGFWLGSDNAGRDLLSRVLWAVRPTMLLVTIIALIRLALGVAIGLVAGFAGRRWQRGADMAIRAALTLPVLVVALAVIAFVGIQRGLLAFLLGLCVTGWAESARYIETQTRTLKTQSYIEAARSMGASPAHLVIYHILRHLLPLTAMLFAFEVSATLMTVAALGFLGYYIGGGVWVTVEDFTARAAAGAPELGQMLATSFELLLQPWTMLVVGGAITTIILGFTLLGEGLRRQLEGEQNLRPQRVDRILARLAAWSAGADGRWRRVGYGAAATVALVALAYLGLRAWKPQTPPQAAAFTLLPPGGHLWATQRHDPHGTLIAPETAPAAPQVAWEFAAPEGLTGVAVAADGTVYAAGAAGTLFALNADGSERWRLTLGEAAVDAPALAADGTIYVVDSSGGVAAVTPDGTQRWRYASEGRRATSGPVVGGDGTIYSTRVDQVQALTPAGQLRWLSGPVDGLWEEPPRLSPDGDLIFLRANAFRTADGQRAELGLTVPPELAFFAPAYIVGGDGATYLTAGNVAVRWSLADGLAQAEGRIEWNLGGLNIYLPSDSGIFTDGFFWIFYGSSYLETRLAWVDPDSRLAANIAAPLRDTTLHAIDATGRGLVCTNRGAARCLALDRATGSIAWDLRLPTGVGVTGAALVPGRVYIVTEDGMLFALAE